MSGERDYYDEVRSVLQSWADAGAGRSDIEWQVQEILDNIEE